MSVFQIGIFVKDTAALVNLNWNVMSTLFCAAFLMINYFVIDLLYVGIVREYAVYVHYVFAMLFSKIILSLQLGHITGESFN